MSREERGTYKVEGERRSTGNLFSFIVPHNSSDMYNSIYIGMYMYNSSELPIIV
jgi:hypothetical protein